jgi:hypothetical protein
MVKFSPNWVQITGFSENFIHNSLISWTTTQPVNLLPNPRIVMFVKNNNEKCLELPDLVRKGKHF